MLFPRIFPGALKIVKSLPNRGDCVSSATYYKLTILQANVGAECWNSYTWHLSYPHI